MRKDVYLFRHGETDANKERRWQGCGFDLPLNDTGLRQARELVSKLSDKKLEVVFSSPLKRARGTAEIVAGALKLPLKFKEGFREGCFGQGEGIVISELDKRWPEIGARWKDPDDFDIGYPGGETKREIQTRMLNALNELLEEEYKVIGVATHGSAMRNLMRALGVVLEGIPNGAVFHLIYEDGCWKAEDF